MPANLINGSDTTLKKLFIPMTFAKSGKRFFDDGRMIFCFIFLLTLALTEGVIISIHGGWYGTPIIGTVPFLWLMVFADFWVHLFLIRVFVLHERALKESYQKYRDNHITTLKPFWSVFDVEDSKLLYMDGRVGMLVSVRHGPVFGRPPQHKITHFTGVTEFIGELSLKGYELRQFNMSVVDPNTEGLKRIQEGMYNMRNSPLYAYQSAMYDYVREICRQVSTIEYEYYLVVGNTMNHILNIDSDVKISMMHLEGTLMSDVHIADKKEIYKFVQLYYNLPYTDLQALMDAQVYGNGKKLITVLESYTMKDKVEKEITPEKPSLAEEPEYQEAESRAKELLQAQQETDDITYAVMLNALSGGDVLADMKEQKTEFEKSDSVVYRDYHNIPRNSIFTPNFDELDLDELDEEIADSDSKEVFAKGDFVESKNQTGSISKNYEEDEDELE